MTSYHYLYRITNLVEQKHYYGIRTSKDILPQDDLGKKYFSSSRDKEFIKNQKEHPENYRYKVVIISDSRQRVADLEIKIHQKFNVGDNSKFYNRVIQSTSGFDPCGKVVMRDKDGTNLYVSTSDPRIATGELTSLNKGITPMLDADGNCIQVSVDDPRIATGELVSVMKGKVSMCDKDGTIFHVSTSDPRIATGELVSVMKGKVVMKDSCGNIIQVSSKDKRIMTEELVSIHKGRAVMKDDNGKNIKVWLNDPRISSGELVGVTKGKVVMRDQIGNCIQVDINDPRIASKELSQINKGRRWIYNLELQKTTSIAPNCNIPEGWKFGRKRF